MVHARLEILEAMIGKYSINELSMLSNISRNTLTKIMAGGLVNKRMLYKLADFLGCHVDVITHYEDLN